MRGALADRAKVTDHGAAVGGAALFYDDAPLGFVSAFFVLHQLPHDTVAGESGEGNEAAAEGRIERIFVLLFGGREGQRPRVAHLHADAHRFRERDHLVEKKLQCGDLDRFHTLGRWSDFIGASKLQPENFRPNFGSSNLTFWGERHSLGLL